MQVAMQVLPWEISKALLKHTVTTAISSPRGPIMEDSVMPSFQNVSTVGVADSRSTHGFCNCRYLGELSDVKFRKADLLKLMAEREGHLSHAKTCIASSCFAVLNVRGVDCRNVITVGEPLKGLKADLDQKVSPSLLKQMLSCAFRLRATK